MLMHLSLHLLFQIQLSQPLQNAHVYTDTAVVGGGFHLDVENGSKPDDHRCDYLGGMKTQVTLTCNSSVKWTDEDISAMFYIHSVDLTDHCQVAIAYSIHTAVSNILTQYQDTTINHGSFRTKNI